MKKCQINTLCQKYETPNVYEVLFNFQILPTLLTVYY